MTYSMLKGLHCIIGLFRTDLAISKFSTEKLTLVCLRYSNMAIQLAIKESLVCFYYIYLNKLCLLYTSNDVISPLTTSRKFAITLVFLVANK